MKNEDKQNRGNKITTKKKHKNEFYEKREKTHFLFCHIQAWHQSEWHRVLPQQAPEVGLQFFSGIGRTRGGQARGHCP